MKFFARLLIVFSLAAFTTGFLTAQEFESASEVTVPEIVFSFSKIPQKTGDTGILVADFILPDGLHQTAVPDFFYIRPVSSQSFDWGKIVYPASETEIEGIPVYTGQVRLELSFISLTNDIPSSLSIEASWQLCYDSGLCLRPVTSTFEVPLAGRFLPDSPSWLAILLFFVAGFAGGLLLNVMPCVLPVLSLKVMGLIRMGGEQKTSVRRNLLLNAAGIVTSLLLLATITIMLKLSGESAGWGFQFQNVYFQLALIILMWLMSLSFFGVWEIGIGFVSAVGRFRKSGEFLSGVLMVALATPCTAPFLGSALGFAFTAPVWAILLIFLSAGIGLAFPFLLLSVFPEAVKKLPKPGAWMETVKILMGFSMSAVVLWLLWVYSYTSPDGLFRLLFFLLLLSAGTWIFAKRLAASGRIKRLLLGILPFLVILVAAFFLVKEFNPIDKAVREKQQVTNSGLPEPWIVFNEDSVKDNLASGRPVFVDFTARWCLTCQINEAGVLSSSAFLSAAETSGLVMMRGDFTNYDPVIAGWLKKYKRAGVPFYLLLNPDGSDFLFPEILGPDFVGNLTDKIGKAQNET